MKTRGRSRCRTVAVAAAFAMTVMAVACSGSAEPPPTQPTATSAAPTPVQPTPTAAAAQSTYTPTPAPPVPTPPATRIPVRTQSSVRTVDRGSGAPAADFELRLFGGDLLTMSDLKGKVVVLNFWASWCPPCRAEMPDFEEMWREMRDDGVVFVGVAVSDSPKEARAFVEATGVTYPVGVDPSGSIASDYRVLSLPTTFLIDREGREARRFGLANRGALRILIRSKLDAE